MCSVFFWGEFSDLTAITLSPLCAEQPHLSAVPRSSVLDEGLEVLLPRF